MLWLNLLAGDVIEAPKRPSPAWVTVVGVKIVSQKVESTLEGLRRAMMKSEAYTLRPNDFEWVGKTGLNVYAHEAWWLKTITDTDFPYLKMAIASDGTLEIRYDENAKDDTSKDTIRTKEISEDDSPLKRGGQRGTGKSGQGGGEGSPAPNGNGEGEPGGEEEGEGEGEGEPADGEGEGEGEGDGEDRDAYEEGKESADSISDDLKEKMKEKMQEKGKPADESGPSSGPAPDGSEGGAPAEDPTGEGTGDGQGTPTEGDGGGQGDADGGEGSGDGDGEGEGEGEGGDGPCDTCGKQGEECACDSPSEDGDAQPTDDPQDASGDGGDEGNIWEQAVALAKEHLEETKKAMYEGRQSDANQNAFSTEMDAKFIKALADAIANDDWEKVGHYMKNLALIGDIRGVSVDDVKKMVEIPDSQPYIDQAQEYAEEARRIADGGDFEYKPPLPPEDEDALQQCVEEAEDGRDSAEEAMQNADGKEAKEEADQASDAADEAKEIADRNGQDPEDNEKVQEAEQYAEEAEEFAELAKELEEEIQELFEESGLDEEDYEEFKEGLLDELFGEDSEFSDELTEREKRLKEKIERREQLMEGRGLVRCVNWETGEIKSFPENETIGDTWIQITKFFSPFETADGKQIVVDRTIEGATQMVRALGHRIVFSKPPNAHYTVDNEEDLVKLVDALKKMRMFPHLTTSYTFPNPHSINISY